MNLHFRFAIVSDLHIALPHTVWEHHSRFHLVEFSIPALDVVLEHLQQLDLDFLLLPGDLTQHGEPENHQWLGERLSQLSFPVYVIPGNHDVPGLLPTERSIGLKNFPSYYEQFGYKNVQQLYYTDEVLPGVQLVALNSNQFDAQGKQLGCLDEAQFVWLEETLANVQHKLVLVMIHHNVIEHLPGQSRHELGRRYMLDNAPRLRNILQNYGVKLIFSGHLHIQDIAQDKTLYEVTTGSLVSYPHPYRVLELYTSEEKQQLKIESYRVKAVPGQENLLEISREWMGDRSLPFMLKLLTESPLAISCTEAQAIAPHLRYFWADIAAGDTLFEFPDFPGPICRYLQQFGAVDRHGSPALIDNQTTLDL